MRASVNFEAEMEPTRFESFVFELKFHFHVPKIIFIFCIQKHLLPIKDSIAHFLVHPLTVKRLFVLNSTKIIYLFNLFT